MIRLSRFAQTLTTPSRFANELSFSNLGVRWNIYEFGLQRMEFILNSRSAPESYVRYSTSQGERIVLYLPDCYRPVTGWVDEVRWLGSSAVKYVVKGPAWRGLFADKVTAEFAAATTVSSALTTILSDHCLVDNGSTTNIATNSTTLSGWQPDHPAGTYPGDAIKQLIAKSDSNNAIYDFWFQDEPFSGVDLQLFEPFYRARSESANVDWRVTLSDLSQITMARSISDIVTTANVYYGLDTGTATGGSHTQLQDTSANFLASGIRPGDQVTHVTATGRDRVVSVDSATQLTLNSISAKAEGTATGGSATTLVDTGVDFTTLNVRANDKVFNDTDGSTGTVTGVAATTVTCAGGFSGGTANAFALGDSYRIASRFQSGDAYSIRTQATSNKVINTLDSTNYWAREITVFEPNMDRTQATQYAGALVGDDPIQVQSFVIAAPWIRDGSNAQHHLFDVIVRGGGYIQIEDLYPASALASTSQDKLTTFFITALDYDHTQGLLRVQVDNPDRRLDVRLRRAKILDSEAIAIGGSS